MAGYSNNLRCMHYRLKRQGMLELDAWLAPLEQAIELNDPQVLAAVDRLLVCEVPELLAMMHGDKPLPETLHPWLSC
ncbi:MAG: succinate dehydrogenase assembly factor 2 [Mariprofundaceae bacterium]